MGAGHGDAAALSPSLTRSQAHCLLSRALSLSLPFSLTHSLTLTPPLSHSLSHSHTLTLSLSLPVSLTHSDRGAVGARRGGAAARHGLGRHAR